MRGADILVEMLIGYGVDTRFTNRPRVFECPSGAGAMYSLPPVAESNGRGVLTELDCAKLFEPV